MASGARRIVEEYKRYYFSGNQARIYFDDEYIGEIVFLEYSISLNKSPIWSYNDKYFKMVANGNILVQGNFGINFIEVGYLYKLANEIKRKNLLQYDHEKDEMIRTMFREAGHDPTTPDGIMRLISTQRGATLNSMTEWYKKKFWQDVGLEDKPGNELQAHPWEFDLDKNGDIDPEGFKISALFGVPSTSRPGMFALKTIQGVHVNGESMVVQPNGQPLLEQYSFFARNIDEDISMYDPIQEVVADKTSLSTVELMPADDNVGSSTPPDEQPTVKENVKVTRLVAGPPLPPKDRLVAGPPLPPKERLVAGPPAPPPKTLLCNITIAKEHDDEHLRLDFTFGDVTSPDNIWEINNIIAKIRRTDKPELDIPEYNPSWIKSTGHMTAQLTNTGLMRASSIIIYIQQIQCTYKGSNYNYYVYDEDMTHTNNKNYMTITYKRSKLFTEHYSSRFLIDSAPNGVITVTRGK